MEHKVWCPAHLITAQMDKLTNREAILSCDTADQLQDQSGQT
jgi:hypothetical protein